MFMNYILNFNQISLKDNEKVGGKNASLGEMIQHLGPLGVKVPAGFALTISAFEEFLKANKLKEVIFKNLEHLDVSDLDSLKKSSAAIREAILQASIPENIQHEVSQIYSSFIQDNTNPRVAVRSSALAEDTEEASFAGQQETFLNISGAENVLLAIKQVYASLFCERAIAYRIHHGFFDSAAISVGIQQMVRSDLGASGVLFTLDTESGFDKVVFITASYGLGELIVQGQVNPDEFYVYKPMLKLKKPAIISRKLGSKLAKMIYSDSSIPLKSLQTIPVPTEEQQRFCITNHDIITLAEKALLIENHYQKAMDIEWGKDGLTGEIYILQARPETIKREKAHSILEHYNLKEKATVKASGRSVGQRIGQGSARVIRTPHEMQQMQHNEILVADMTDPDWEPIMKKAAAIVTNRGGRTCHAAIVARELGIPAVVGCGDATEKMMDGEIVTVSCAEGETGFVYEGNLPFEIEKTEIGQMPSLPVHVCMNVANPEQVFHWQFIPNDGVGLTRLEFIISNMIGIHPNACLRFSELPKNLQTDIQARTLAYGSPREFYIEKLCEGIATIAAAFYPKPIIVRFSDFKSNEYANLLGGDLYEPHEENPMLGYRGGARYLSAEFQEAFVMECEAVKRVRNQLGLLNTHLMFPFVRTLGEAEALLALLKKNGLERGQDELKVYLMCEIPSNVLLAEQFLEHVDGFSIGSNDLTQLTLGLDRDSGLIANLFDERNPAVRVLLHQVISTCNRLGKYVGICGQGPSDHPDFAKWLMQEGIQSISLTPDSVISTWLALTTKN
jgi:pyruvate,water dikinase